jgi:hypothetical protein
VLLSLDCVLTVQHSHERLPKDDNTPTEALSGYFAAFGQVICVIPANTENVSGFRHSSRKFALCGGAALTLAGRFVFWGHFGWLLCLAAPLGRSGLTVEPLSLLSVAAV